MSTALSPSMFEHIVRSAPDAILVTTLPAEDGTDPVIIFANRSFEEQTGYSAEELVGTGISILHGRETDPDVVEEMFEAMHESRNFSAELVHYRKNGESYWVEINISPLIDENGEVTFFISISRDISEKKKLEETLNLQASILDQVQNAVVVYDRNREIIYWNTYAEELFQYRAHEMLGTSQPVNLTAKGDAEKGRHAMQQLLHNGFWRGELTLERKDGTEFTGQVNNRVFVNHLGEILGYITVSNDITRQRQIQTDLENSLREKEVLLKEIHHRVKNNMQIISSLLFLQSMQAEDQLIQEILIESQNRVRSMSMVHEKLYRSHDLSRIPFDDYIRELAGDLMNTWVGDSTVIRKHFELEPVEIDIDKAIPCGLLVNELISNALKHGFKGVQEGNIFLRLTKREGEVHIEIQNDGNLLPEGFKIDATETLGMQLIDSLTRQLEGELTYRREPSTLFSLRFKDLLS